MVRLPYYFAAHSPPCNLTHILGQETLLIIQQSEDVLTVVVDKMSIEYQIVITSTSLDKAFNEIKKRYDNDLEIK
ncbi:hypothetical protein Ppb6_03975 [Photorhabdus australis subsp. thailandensis]|uniref:Uncharacterized protein n=1 Tax=Photorhabdus australis subsp. thailandensis TaxID=2805096 RepID=A0A1C0TYY0_9GAMM|nr:hypothetical protein Ppb6_03975 [Photorhabdus australis subsp. thailandensis]